MWECDKITKNKKALDGLFGVNDKIELIKKCVLEFLPQNRNNMSKFQYDMTRDHRSHTFYRIYRQTSLQSNPTYLFFFFFYLINDAYDECRYILL